MNLKELKNTILLSLYKRYEQGNKNVIPFTELCKEEGIAYDSLSQLSNAMASLKDSGYVSATFFISGDGIVTKLMPLGIEFVEGYLLYENNTSLLPRPEKPIVELGEWAKIERIVTKIHTSRNEAKDEEDFQRIGLLCREVIKLLAKTIYDPIKHGDADNEGTKIGNADSNRMIRNYIEVTLKGKDNKELRDYGKTANAIANQLTHKDTATKKDMLLAMSSTLSLINFIGILEDKYI